MSKAEERGKTYALHKASKKSHDYYGNAMLSRVQFDGHDIKNAYGEGYQQAEKDLALTIEDIEKIHTFLYVVKNNKQGVFTFTRLSDEQYQEVLNRFNKLKER